MMRMVGAGLFFAALPFLMLGGFGAFLAWPWQSLAVVLLVLGAIFGPIIHAIIQGNRHVAEARRKMEERHWQQFNAGTADHVHALLDPGFDARTHAPAAGKVEIRPAAKRTRTGWAEAMQDHLR